MDGDSEVLTPPVPKQVVARAVALYIITCRCQLEIDLAREAEPKSELQAELDDMRQFVAETADLVLSNQERRLFDSPLGGWKHSDIVDQSWRRESLVVFLWALTQVGELPRYDTQARSPEGFKGDDLIDLFLTGVPRLRPEAEIEAARDAAELWHWRSRKRQVEGSTGPYTPDGKSLEDVVAGAAQTSFRNGWSDAPIDGDFPALGKAYRDLDEQEFQSVTSIAMERHRALNWLCGFSQDWDQVPTDT